MRILALLLLALPALGAPTVTRVDPPYGYRFGPTNVTITGSGFVPGSVQVFFGTYAAAVNLITPTTIRATIAPPVPVADDTHVDVRVVVAGQGEAVLSHAFTFTDVADGADNFVRYLVPITGQTIGGANGSQWKGELAFFNGSAFEAVVVGPFASPGQLSPPAPNADFIAPNWTTKPMLFGNGTGGGAFVYVPLPLDTQVRKSLRVRDVSRNANSWGAAIPFVAKEELADTITLIDIPTDAQYRATLRIYDCGTNDDVPVRVTIFPQLPAPALAQFELTAHATHLFSEFPGMPFYPAYAQVDLLTPAIRAATPTIRVQIENLGRSLISPPIPTMWAMVSVTNNDTQQVTMITP